MVAGNLNENVFIELDISRDLFATSTEYENDFELLVKIARFKTCTTFCRTQKLMVDTHNIFKQFAKSYSTLTDEVRGCELSDIDCCSFRQIASSNSRYPKYSLI